MHYVARGDTVNHRLVDMGYQISEEEIRDHNIGVTLTNVFEMAIQGLIIAATRISRKGCTTTKIWING